jgi:hypothetical protein
MREPGPLSRSASRGMAAPPPARQHVSIRAGCVIEAGDCRGKRWPHQLLCQPPHSHAQCQEPCLARGGCLRDGVRRGARGRTVRRRPQRCLVIAALLRSYRDRPDDRRRHDLCECAANAVGTRSTREVEQAGAKLCHRWAGRLQSAWLRRQPALGPPPRRMAPTIVELLGFHRPEHTGHRAASAAAHDVDERLHRATPRFVDELIGLGVSAVGWPPSWAPALESATTARAARRREPPMSAPQR